MSEPLVLTFDMGTQSARALLVDRTGTIVHKAQKRYDPAYYSLQPGWAEQKPSFYWGAICETSLELKERSGGKWDDIIAVSCTTIRDTCLCLGKDNEPLRDVILWLDGRETEGLKIPGNAKFLFRLAKKLDTVQLQQKVSACNWIAKHEPELWAKTQKFVFLSAWLTWRFCGVLADSSANMIGHIPFDSKLRDWMKPGDLRRNIFNIKEEMQPILVEPGDIVGKITHETARQTGIAEGIPFIATGSDKGCETLGLSCLTSDKAALSFGTTATVQVTTEKYVESLPFIPPYPAVIRGHYNPEIEIYRGYWLISWFKREFCAKEVEEAKRLDLSAEQLLNKRLCEIPPGCDGLMLQPYFTPGIMMPHARGAVIGFSDIHTRIHIYRAIVEGINFGLIDGLRTIEKRGKLKVENLFVAGGGSQSDAICQITASMFGRPVYRTQTYEVSGLGSALIAFVSQGVFPSYGSAISSMVHIRDEFLPDNDEHRVYDQLFERVYAKVYERLEPLYREIPAITKEREECQNV